MPVIKMTAKKMSNADVQFISLVERGANRIPFKVIKQEKEMSKNFAGLDLGSIFTRKSEKKPEVAEIVGIVTLKGEGFESIKKQVEEAGFKVDDMEEMEDGSVVFKQGEFDGEGSVVRLNEHLALITKGFSPYNLGMEDESSFSELAAARGFFPGINSIMGSLSEMVETSVRKAATPAEAQKAVSKMFDEAKAYTASFMSSLPQKAFKLEGIMPEVVEKEEGAAQGGDNVTPVGETAPEGEAPAAVVAAPEGEAPAGETPVEKSEGEPQKSLTAEEVADIVRSTVEATTNDLVKKMGDIGAAMVAATKSLEGLQNSVATLSTRVEETESVAKAAQEAVTGTVVAGVQSGSDGMQVQKRDREYQGREIDTAFMPKVRKSSRQ